MQFDGGVHRARQAPGSKDAHRHVEVAPELLAKYVGRDLRGPEQRVQAVVDRQVLVNAVAPVGVVVALLLLDQLEMIRAVTVDLVGGW